ncbi:MAG TPA: hypothetical protein VEW48_02775 [Thermoanaerobaculia bacterium]|nr:hypothetical protein [Thermoanaerobaculia bacterium]
MEVFEMLADIVLLMRTRKRLRLIPPQNVHLIPIDRHCMPDIGRPGFAPMRMVGPSPIQVETKIAPRTIQENIGMAFFAISEERDR